MKMGSLTIFLPISQHHHVCFGLCRYHTTYNTIVSLLHKHIDKWHKTFYLKKLGTPQYFLGIEVHHHPIGAIILTQTKYIKDLLSNVNMPEEKGVNTPMFNTYKLNKNGDDKLCDPFPIDPRLEPCNMSHWPYQIFLLQ